TESTHGKPIFGEPCGAEHPELHGEDDLVADALRLVRCRHRCCGAVLRRHRSRSGGCRDGPLDVRFGLGAAFRCRASYGARTRDLPLGDLLRDLVAHLLASGEDEYPTRPWRCHILGGGVVPFGASGVADPQLLDAEGPELQDVASPPAIVTKRRAYALLFKGFSLLYFRTSISFLLPAIILTCS
ncbi:MAG: hypothetical protein KDD55_10860, partial [Bdellovibrionales bacterium]|nr:hypothetical protein [Bdellovibrionales bacterium]